MATTQAQNNSRLALAAVLATAGVSHLTFARKPFHAQVPPWMPVSADTVVVGSGALEISLGAALLFAPEPVRPIVGCAAAGFFTAIFPGNLAQWQLHRDAFGLSTDERRFARLFFQPLLIGWALWSTGALNFSRRRS